VRYTPFEKGLNEIEPQDLAILQEVHEGWYVEYKSEVIAPRALAKSLSSFANQYGGWLIIGIVSDPNTNVAMNFPGIPLTEVPVGLESLKNATKDLLRPEVFYQTREFEGPIKEIGLPAGQVIVVVSIPQGPDTPYVHNDGRIYLRIADSSEPRPLSDRSTFDLLAERGETSRESLTDRVTREPIVSKAEDKVPYVHLTICSDPYRLLDHKYTGTFDDFSALMSEPNFPFDNVFTMSDGFVARQTAGNNAYMRGLTWEFSRDCDSFITIPLITLTSDDNVTAWNIYEHGISFKSKFLEFDLTSSRILDLNYLLDAFMVIFHRHLKLTYASSVNGPFYIKAFVNNVWRSVPFVDLKGFSDHISKWGLPIVQDDDILAPPGTTLDTFIVLPELETSPYDLKPHQIPATYRTIILILQALGIPTEALRDSADELAFLGKRRQEVQRAQRTADRR